MMKYYISGPIGTAGKKEENIDMFKQSTIFLRESGYDIVSPIEIHHPKNCDWFDYMRGDIKKLLNCKAIIMLPGWPQSKGARIELMLAIQLDMKVYYFNGKLISMNFD